MIPLFEILRGGSHLNSPRQLNEGALKALKLVKKAINKHFRQLDNSLSRSFIDFGSSYTPTGVLRQDGPL